jgi:predicted TIM-barrel fold metal-dependent hydrolase
MPAPLFNRRQFTRLLLATAGVAVGVPGCTSSADYSADDRDALARQMREEAAASGHGRFGKVHFRGYRGLAELPYFDLDEHGLLRLTVDGLPPVIDFHAHLGMNFLFAPDIDLLRRTPRTQYFLDLDLDVYINSAFTEATHADMSREVRNQLTLGSAAAATHTIPNLLAEMDAVGVAQVALLPIALGLPFGDNLTERWLDAIAHSGAAARFIPFASVHPRDGHWRERLRGYAGRGVRGLKVHPEMQRVAPDDARMLEVYGECERLGLVVIFHGGRSGIEPEFMRPYAVMRRYAGAVAAFPRVQFVLGHAGARDVAEAVRLAEQHPQVWLEITGQGATQLDGLVERIGANRLLFGSDWPFYHLAATLAKVLLVTEGRPDARTAILHDNAERVLATARATAL